MNKTAFELGFNLGMQIIAQNKMAKQAQATSLQGPGSEAGDPQAQIAALMQQAALSGADEQATPWYANPYLLAGGGGALAGGGLGALLSKDRGMGALAGAGIGGAAGLGGMAGYDYMNQQSPEQPSPEEIIQGLSPEQLQALISSIPAGANPSMGGDIAEQAGY